MTEQAATAALDTRPMTPQEFAEFRAQLVSSYAASHVTAGNWTAQEALERSAQQIDGLLPGGERTEGMLLLAGLTADGEYAGHVWVALEKADEGGGAWIYDIEVRADQRGKGYGRALLAAAEREAARHGVPRIGLNVFGPNAVARSLYESAGYEIVTLQMRKTLIEP